MKSHETSSKFCRVAIPHPRISDSRGRLNPTCLTSTAKLIKTVDIPERLQSRRLFHDGLPSPAKQQSAWNVVQCCGIFMLHQSVEPCRVPELCWAHARCALSKEGMDFQALGIFDAIRYHLHRPGSLGLHASLDSRLRCQGIQVYGMRLCVMMSPSSVELKHGVVRSKRRRQGGPNQHQH